MWPKSPIEDLTQQCFVQSQASNCLTPPLSLLENKKKTYIMPANVPTNESNTMLIAMMALTVFGGQPQASSVILPQQQPILFRVIFLQMLLLKNIISVELTLCCHTQRERAHLNLRVQLVGVDWHGSQSESHDLFRIVEAIVNHSTQDRRADTLIGLIVTKNFCLKLLLREVLRKTYRQTEPAIFTYPVFELNSNRTARSRPNGLVYLLKR